MACLCAKNYKTIYAAYLGYANEEQKIPIDGKTRFRIFSMTKLITCTAALMLFERGKFALSDPLSMYFPEYKNPLIYVKDKEGYHTEKSEKEITIKDCFTMTCGLPYDINEEDVSALMRKREEVLIKEHGKNYDIVSEVRAMAQIPLMFTPGSHYYYGYGHDILAALIQLLSGERTSDFIQKEIFDPVGMTDTAYRYRSEEDRKHMCTPYETDEQGRRHPIPGARDAWHEMDANYDMGGAGLFSTAPDYLKFTQVLANGGKTEEGQQLIGRHTIDLMRTNQLQGAALQDFQNSGKHESYGYGLGVRTRIPGIGDLSAPVGEFGWGGFLGSYNSIDPSSGFSCVYMHQLMPDLNDYWHPRLNAAIYGMLADD